MNNGTVGVETETITKSKVRWARIVLGAFLLETVLFVVLVPIGQVFGTQVFLVAVPIGCFVFGFLFGLWVVRPIRSGFVLHGAFMGILATALYVGLCAISPGSIPAAVAVYGLPLFLLANGLRIAGCIGGAVTRGRKSII
jgi:hypothetical protein